MEMSEGRSDSGLQWFLVYADVVTLVVATLIMMYAVAAVATERFQQRTVDLDPKASSKATAGGLRSSGIYGHDIDSGYVFDEGLKFLKLAIENYVCEESLNEVADISLEARGLVITLASDNYLFPVDEAELRAPALPFIDEIGRLLSEVSNPFAIECSTSRVPVSGGRYSSIWGLSAARSCSLARRLLGKWDVNGERLVAMGCIDTRLIASNDREDNQRQRSRVELIVIPNSRM